mmetsp:Transcript_37091/g.80091  ORF Transcript_37091/g.80091 Transcript_37091/m.80091 type:complete len:215 (+) Transcript_37091:115-759(+)
MAKTRRRVLASQPAELIGYSIKREGGIRARQAGTRGARQAGARQAGTRGAASLASLNLENLENLAGRHHPLTILLCSQRSTLQCIQHRPPHIVASMENLVENLVEAAIQARVRTSQESRVIRGEPLKRGTGSVVLVSLMALAVAGMGVSVDLTEVEVNPCERAGNLTWSKKTKKTRLSSNQRPWISLDIKLFAACVAIAKRWNRTICEEGKDQW